MGPAVVLAALLLALAGSCGTKDSSPHQPPTAEPRRDAPARVENAAVEVHGTVHEIMMEGNTEGRVALADVATADDAYGLGALGELRGEVTIAGGEAWLAYPDGADTARVASTDSPDEDATLLVLARVPAWISLSFEDDVGYADLGARISAMARAAGWSGEGALPFLVEGDVRALDWHVIDGSRMAGGHGGHRAHLESAVRGHLQGGAPLLVGFYSTEHQGVFTHAGSTIHVHVVDAAREVSGHVDDVTIAAGATLRLPSAENESRGSP